MTSIWLNPRVNSLSYFPSLERFTLDHFLSSESVISLFLGCYRVHFFSFLTVHSFSSIHPEFCGFGYHLQSDNSPFYISNTNSSSRFRHSSLTLCSISPLGLPNRHLNLSMTRRKCLVFHSCLK